MAYEERVVDPATEAVYAVGSPSEKVRLIAKGYKEVKPPGEAAAASETKTEVSEAKTPAVPEAKPDSGEQNPRGRQKQ